MTDGAYGIDAGTARALPDDEFNIDLYAHASRNASKPTHRQHCLADFAEWLPQLGPVLWLQHCNAEMHKQPCMRSGPTLLLDHPALNVLSACSQLRAHQAITPHGPREWLCFCSESGSVEARLYLLPDTDSLAWDEMTASLSITPAAAECREPPTHTTFLGRAFSRFGQRWQARLLEFRCMQRPWLNVLGAQPPLRISLLGIDIARSIVRDEYAEWISPMHSG